MRERAYRVCEYICICVINIKYVRAQQVCTYTHTYLANKKHTHISHIAYVRRFLSLPFAIQPQIVAPRISLTKSPAKALEHTHTLARAFFVHYHMQNTNDIINAVCDCVCVRARTRTRGFQFQGARNAQQRAARQTRRFFAPLWRWGSTRSVLLTPSGFVTRGAIAGVYKYNGNARAPALQTCV